MMQRVVLGSICYPFKLIRVGSATKQQIEAQTSAGITAPGHSPLLDWLKAAESGAISSGSGRRYKQSTLDSYKV